MIPESIQFPSYIYLHTIYDPNTSTAIMAANKECTICLSKLQDHESEYPLLCPENCSTNICTYCSANFLKCSDGGHRNKIDLPSCPKCNADISHAIKDTHLMRCVRQVQLSSSKDVSDSDLTGEELRVKYSASKEEIENAQQRLDGYSTVDRNIGRPHISSSEPGTTSRPTTVAGIDTDLLSGLEGFMSIEEQRYITELLTSGVTNQVAKATQILSEIRRIHPSTSNTSDSFQNLNKKMVYPLKSLFAKKTRLGVAEQRAIDMSIPSASEGGLCLALPRMPKYVVLKADFDAYARHSKILKFKDDTWDGSLADAFSRMYTGNSDDRRSDDDDDDDDDDDADSSSEESKSENRVVITSSRGQAARVGIVKGDVVSHINMEEFHGCAENLREMIQHFYISGSGSGTFSMVLNGDQATADELRKRQVHYTS